MVSNFSLPRWAGPAFLALVAIGVLLVIFRLGTQASAGVALNDPVVWVEDGARGRLLQINGSTREITAQVDVGEDGDSIVALPQGRDAVFLNRTTGVVGVVGAVSLSVDSEDAGPGEAGLTGDGLQLLANHQSQTDWTDAYIVSDLKTLVYEPGVTVRSEIRIPEANGALTDTVVNADGDLVAITGDSGQVVYSTELGLEQLVSLPPLISENAARPGLVRAGESVYLVDSARRVVNQISNDGELGEGVPICGSPGDVQISGNVLSESDGTHRILVHDALAGLLSVVEPGENECRVIELEETGTNWGAPVAVDGTGYLPNYDTGEIVVVDLVDRVVADNFTFRPATGRAFELEVFDGAVWANEPDGFRAAVVTRDEIVAISKLGSVFFGGDGADGSGPGAFAGDDDADGPRVFDNAAPAFRTDDGNGGGLNTDDVVVGGGPTIPSLDEDGEVVADPDAAAEDQADPPESTVPPNGSESPDPVDPDIVDPAIEPQAPIDAVVVDRVEPEGVIEELDADELIANFVFSSDTINVGEEVRLSDDSTGTPTSWNWDFGDGTSASGPEVTKIWENEGIFTVTLFAANADGDLSEQTHEFTVIAENIERVPSAAFTLSAETIEAGDSVTFTDTSTGDPQSWLWEFGDGSTGAGPEITHTYDEAGIYNVTLTASNNAGPNSVTTQVTVVSSVEPPVAVIARPFPGVVEVGQTVTLVSESTNTPTVTSWDFDDGDSTLGETVRHSWNTPGEYRIRLSVSNSAGSDEAIAVVVVEARVSPPIARFGQTALQVVEGEELRFNDLSLNAPTSLTWDFGDGSTGTGANVAHTWTAPGTYQVTLTATNGAGSDDVSKTVTVDEIAVDPPVAGFTASTTSVQVDAVVVFTDTSTGSPTGWSWNFGDGTGTSTVANPTYSFDSPGTYTVSLTTTNNGGSDSTTATIVVIDPPAASFTSAATELDVVFTDTSVNGPTSWSWNFGDGSTSTVRNPSHTYSMPGSYPVTLVASNAAGDSIPFTSTVTVDKAPTADFTFTTGGLTAQFTNASTDGPTTYLWDFDDGAASSSLLSPAHTYSASGTYDVTLTVTNAAGSDSVTKQVAVTLAPPEAIFSCTVAGSGVSCDGNDSTSAVSYSWSSPGGSPLGATTSPTVSFNYPATNSYDVTLTVENVEGTSDSATMTVTVTVPEPPTITGLAVSSNNNGTVVLAASASNSPTGWTWTNLDGGTITAGAGTSSPTIEYTTPGSKTVTVEASNAVGTSAPSSTTFTVNIAAPPEITTINANNNAGTVQLDAVVTNTPVTYAWTTSGGTLSSATAAAPILTVTTNGQYTVNLTVTNADGSDSGSRTFTVNDIPDPPPVVSVSVGAEGPPGTVAVSATATNNPTSWTWSVPAATSSTGTGGANPTFSFPSSVADVDYQGTVTASNASGSSAPVNFTITIAGTPPPIPPPTASFTFSQPDPASTVAGFNFSGSAQPGATITWLFTGGTPATASGASTSTDFTMAGSYSVTVTVADAGGSDTFTQSVLIT